MLVELCRSFDVPGSTGTKKVGPEFSFICCAQFHMKTLCFSVLQDELVTIVMEFLMEHCSGIIYTDPDKAQLLSCQVIWAYQFVTTLTLLLITDVFGCLS